MLTKNNYITGLKCKKKMNLDRVNKYEISAEILQNAIEFKKIVQSNFNNILIINKDSLEEKIKETKNALKKNQIIGNAYFKSSNMLVKIDILEKTKTGYNIYDIKSSTAEKEDYINELAYNYYVASHILKIDKAFLVQPHKIEVVDKFNPKDMVLYKDKTEEIKNIMNSVAINTYLLKEAIEQNCLEYEINYKCRVNSVDCPYFKECLNIKKGNIFDLSGIPFNKKIDYFNKGIITKEDIIKDGTLNAKREELLNTISINKKEINNFLRTIEYPISYLDFETVSFLVPRYKHHTVNSKIAIQYSLHVKEKNNLFHYYNIEKANTDPRRKIAEHLVKNIPKKGSIIVYHASFESSVLANLAELYSDLKEDLLNMRERLIDLEIIFKNKYYYDPLFYGSSSIKAVLPTLFPNDEELNYKKFKHVHNGLEAASYLRQDNYSDEIKKDLLEYCKLDTLAMVKIHEFLNNLIKNN